VLRSTDNGDSWTGLSSNNILVLAISPNGHIFAGAGAVAGVDGSVFRSTDNGDHWTKTHINRTVNALAINAQGHLFAGSAFSTINNGVLRSIDDGKTWTLVNSGLTDVEVKSLTINANGHIFAGTSSGSIFRSTNNGDIWSQVFRNPQSPPPEVTSFSINTKGHIFAGTNGSGVLRSTDNGSSWTPVNNGLKSLNVLCLAVAANNGYLFAGTDGGVFRSAQSTTVVQERNTESLPSSFLLDQNYPNPFNPETRIAFQLPAASQVWVRIFNVRGQEIRTLANAQYEAGTHSVRWVGRDKNGNSVASGVYLYQLKAGGFSQVRKMSLLR
jgi:photosystem II stability/assembly factor-like uncharacterized protein